MLKQYSILSKCLSELKKSELPVIEKLKLEVQLIQTKRILLDYKVEVRVTGALRSEQEFNELFEQVQSVCNTRGTGGELDRLKARIHEIKQGLSPSVFGACSSPVQSNPSTPQGTGRSALASLKDVFR
jgi:hypothetical protein